MSFGETFGKPVHAMMVLSVKNLVENPPKALRKHNGTNKDLRRHVIESCAPEALERIFLQLRQGLTESLRLQDSRLLAAACCLRHLPKHLRLRVLDLALARDSIVLAVGCVKGQHRSVSIVEHFAPMLGGLPSLIPYFVDCVHRDVSEGRNVKKSEKQRHKQRRHRK